MKSKAKCLWCTKEFIQKITIKKKGMLKGHKIADKICCSKICNRYLNKQIKIGCCVEDMKEELAELNQIQKEMRKKQ